MAQGSRASPRRVQGLARARSARGEQAAQGARRAHDVQLASAQRTGGLHASEAHISQGALAALSQWRAAIPCRACRSSFSAILGAFAAARA